MEGFDLLSTEIFASTSTSTNQCDGKLSPAIIPPIGCATKAATLASTTPMATTVEGDAWAMSMENAERVLFTRQNVAKVLSVLKTLRDRHLDYPGAVTTNYVLRTLVLWECEKHINDQEWQDYCLSDRIIGFALIIFV